MKKKTAIQILSSAIYDEDDIEQRPLYEVFHDFSPKQLEMLNTKMKRLNIAEGSVRSGKTFLTLFLWVKFVKSCPKKATFLMCAKTLTSLKRNILDLLIEIAGAANFEYSLSAKEGKLFGRKIYLEGADNERAESKIRGMTLTGAYLDEITLMPESFFAMILSRLSVKGAKLIGTTNPDSPGHWLMKNYLKNIKLNLARWRFVIEDNPSLEQDYIDNLKNEYTGLRFKRFILGEWVAAEGAVYESFNDKHIITEEQFRQRLKEHPLAFCDVGVDFGGNKSATTFTLVGFTLGFEFVFIIDEHYDAENKSGEHVVNDFKTTIKKWRTLYKVVNAFCDSAEQLLIKSFKRAGTGIAIKNARKSKINDRIHLIDMLMAQDRFYIVNTCINTIESIQSAIYNDDGKRLDDGTINIDSLDSMEYAIEKRAKPLLRRTNNGH